MNKKKKKRWHLLLYSVIAVIVLLSLIVLPLADTDNPDPSVGNTQYVEDESLTVGTTVTGSAISVGTVSGGAITGGSGGDTEDPEVGDKEGEKPDKKPNEEKEQKRTEYDYQDDNIIVKAVFSDAAAVPDNAELFVTPITEEMDSEQYIDIEARINESVEVENQNVTNFLAYDIYFMADGIEYEPELGSVNVTIQYKTELFEKSIKDISDEVKVLHLKETIDGIQVEDVTHEISLINYDESVPINNDEQMIEDNNDSKGEGIVPGTTSDMEREEVGIELGDETRADDDKVEQEETTDTGAKEERPEENEIENSHADSVTFVTDSFSTFVVIGLSSTKPVINVTMKFVHGDGRIDTSISGTYYLNITNTKLDRYNLALRVKNGIAEAQISGVYDRNSNTNAGSLFLLKNETYTAVLFEYPSECNDKFEWLDTHPTNFPGCIRYVFDSTIQENYKITELSSAVTVTSGVGEFVITATAKPGIKFSSSQILTALSPVIPYSVFAKEFYLKSDMDGCIAVQTANIQEPFGNTSNENYYTYSPISLITVKKKYNGVAQKTFRFGLFRDNSILLETTTITLPTVGGGNTASATFTNVDTTRDTVYELDDDNNKLGVGAKYKGFTLMSVEREQKTTLSMMNYTSYIENIRPGSKKDPFKSSGTGQKHTLVVGSHYRVSQEGGMIQVFDGNNELISTTSSVADIYAAEKGNFPINFDETLSEMAALSVRLATALSTDTVMVKSMTIEELNKKNNQELIFDTNGKMLLLNIDATGSAEISLRANAALVVNNGRCGGWTEQANNIIVNIFTRNSTGYSAYTGSINDAGLVMGTLLVPCARVNSLSQSFNGNIVAQYVYTSDEIHGNTLGVTTVETVYAFTNTAIGSILLPMTGGMGTQIFYKLGSGMILLGIVAFAIYQRYRNKPYNLSG